MTSLMGSNPFMAALIGRNPVTKMSLGNYDVDDDDDESDYDPDEDLHMMFDDEEYEEMHENY